MKVRRRRRRTTEHGLDEEDAEGSEAEGRLEWEEAAIVLKQNLRVLRINLCTGPPLRA